MRIVDSLSTPAGEGERPAGRGDLGAAGGIFAGLFAIYALGASPTIYVGDSGELVTAVHLLGIPHPSGYPLYVLLGKLWTLLVPAGSIAFRMSLFSSACASAACALLFLVARRMKAGRPAALFGALILAFAPSFWSQANIQRVYALNALFVILATGLAWLWHETGRDRWLITAFLACGVGATNHLFMGVLGVCLGLFVLVTRPSLLRRPRVALLSGLAFLAGLVPYLYLPIRSRMNPRLDWGNPETLEGFLDVVFRQDFWNRAWYEGPADLLVAGLDYLASFGPELAWLGAAAALAALVAGWKGRGLFLALPLMIMGANAASMALHGSRVDLFFWHRYYIPSYVMAALLAGLGADRVARMLPRRAAPALLLIPLAALLVGWRDHDRSRYAVSESFSRTVLSSLPPGAHLIATDDNILFTSMYLHLVEGVRPDVNLILQGVGGIQLPSLRFNPDEDPLFFTHHPNWNMPELEIVPVGLTFRAWRGGRDWPDPEPLPPELEGESDRRVPKDHLTQNLIGQFHYMKGITFEQRDWLLAVEEFAKARAASPDNDVLFYNLGLILRRNGLPDRALEAFRRSHAINPRHLASHSRPRASEKIAEVEAELDRVRQVEREVLSDPSFPAAEQGSEAWHVLLAQGLEARGETAAARGHLLQALEKRGRGEPGGVSYP